MLPTETLKNIPIAHRVLIGAVIGIIVGLIMGNNASIFQPIGNVYAMLMEGVVFPYVISTLLLSLGGLKPSLSARLFKKGWLFYVFLLVLTFATLIILGMALPINMQLVPTATQNRLTQQAILQLLVPANVFADLANNYVPAVIIFCLIFGLALQRIENKTNLFVVLEIISKTCLVFWNWLVTLVPIVTFALLANLAGTMHTHQLYDVSEFLILFLIAVVMLFWLLPAMIKLFTGIRYQVLFYELRDALIVSAVTTLSVVAIPYLERIIVKFIGKEDNLVNKEENEIIKTILLVSYPFAQLGNFLVYLFILFAALYYDQALLLNQFYILPLMTYLSGIGSPSTSINSVQFLSAWLGLPNDTVNLYISLMPIIRYGQVLLSVLAFAFLGILIAHAFFKKIKKINYLKLCLQLGIAFLVLFAIAMMLNRVFPNPDEKLFNRLQSFSLNPQLLAGVNIKILPPFDESKVRPVKITEDALFRIQRTGVIRIGFNADMRPFVFYNNKKQLVGYDIAYAVALAKAFNSRIEFVPFTWPHLLDDLNANQFDIAMSAIYATEERLKNSAFTAPYFHSPASVVIPKTRLSDFRTAEQMKYMSNLRIGVFDDPVLIPLVQKNFPNAKIVILPNVSGNAPAVAFAQNKIDAVLWSQVQTDVWTLAHPDYISTIPQGIAAPFLMAYMVQNTSPQFLNFLNYWLTLKKNDGFQQSTYTKWILIRNPEDR